MNKAPSVKETAIIKQSRLLVSNFHFDRGKPVYYTYISSLVKHYMESPTFKNQQKSLTIILVPSFCFLLLSLNDLQLPMQSVPTTTDDGSFFYRWCFVHLYTKHILFNWTIYICLLSWSCLMEGGYGD
jgi:hypothetical protein